MRKDSGSDAVVIGAGDDDKSVNQGDSGCAEVEEDSRDLGGSRESKEEEVDESGSRGGLKDASKEDAQAVTNDSIMIDVKPQRGLGESLDQEKLCRICHLSSERGWDANASKFADKGSRAANHTTELIPLGCGCKDELGMVHSRCAEAWLKLRWSSLIIASSLYYLHLRYLIIVGYESRLCKICSETAKNVSGAGYNRFMEKWNDGRGNADTRASSSEVGGSWSRQPFCNLLIVCVVMAFILPWFFCVNLF